MLLSNGMSNDNFAEKIDLKPLDISGKNILKPDWGKLAEATDPSTTKYRIINGEKVKGYERDILSPGIEDSEIVLQSTYSVAGRDSGKRYLASFAAGPCVIATPYDPSSKTGAMAHFDSRSNVAVAMREIGKKLGGNSQDWQMRIVGGHRRTESSKAIIKDLRGKATFAKIPIIEGDVLEEAGQRDSVSVALDTDTGMLYDLPTDYLKQLPKEQNDKLSELMQQLENDTMSRIGEVKFMPDLMGKK